MIERLRRFWANWQWEFECNLLRRFSCALSREAKDCAAASLQTVLQHFGTNCSMAEMRDLLRLDLQGADLDTLCEAARRLGFEASYGRAKQASEELLPVPFIAHIEDGGIGHFVVVHQIRWGHAIIADPASGLMRLTIPEFQKRWSRCVILLRPVKPFPKRKSVKTSPMRHLLRTAAMDGRLLGGLTLTSVLGTALSLVAPLAFMYLMKPGGRTDRTLLGFALLAALFSRLTATLIRELITHRYNQTFDFSVGTMYLTNVIALPLREIECRSAGDFYSRLLEICRIRTAITTSILNFAISCLTYLVCLCILVRTNLLLATICLAGTPLAWWILNRSSQRIAELQHDLQCRISASASASVEALSCMRAIKGMCGESSILERLTIRYSAAQGAAHSRDFRAGLINILIAGSSGITMIVLLLAGFALIDRGTINLSLLFICTTLTGLIWSTLEGGVPAVVSIREALESLGRIEDIVAVSRKAATVNPEPKPSVSSVKSVQELRLEQISYAYRNEPVLAGVSTRFKQGELIAVLGESGSGKSTLACVLAGLFSPDSGAILADGFIATPEFLRSRVEVVFQDANVLSGTIRENLLLADASIDDAQLEFAARQACAHEFISQLPRGYGYEVGTYAVGLSTGQRQRIALARAFLRKPPILILDEATSGIDTETEDKILANLKKQRTGLITIIITHRLTNAAKSDHCLILKRGEVQREGSYHELYGNVSCPQLPSKSTREKQYDASTV